MQAWFASDLLQEKSIAMAVWRASIAIVITASASMDSEPLDMESAIEGHDVHGCFVDQGLL